MMSRASGLPCPAPSRRDPRAAAAPLSSRAAAAPGSLPAAAPPAAFAPQAASGRHGDGGRGDARSASDPHGVPGTEAR
ncbi:hypothetical protein SAMN05216258_103490 [Albimonas pacifica]|uniref:Uncharacterized protein n=1 Tax=Albimonas pacifica TaxID=1114924 RepID=A0A1I3ENI9_9RHOB|nr:hypothetical protein SAMN05216258_103490 [Albimonas pacifica]